jgi:diguanylate cyclase (GGDEF)-like protein
MLANGAAGGDLTKAAAVRLPIAVVIWAAVGLLLSRYTLRVNEQTSTLQEQAHRDPLTGLHNRRALADLSKSAALGDALVLLDLDHFKAVNDTHGHLAGDRVLVDVAQALRTALRSQDTLARQGGDEFSILAPEMDSEQVHHLVRRVHEALAAGVDGSLTTSVGWATFPDDGADADALLNLADADLRRAKRTPAPRREKRDAQPLMVPVTESG